MPANLNHQKAPLNCPQKASQRQVPSLPLDPWSLLSVGESVNKSAITSPLSLSQSLSQSLSLYVCLSLPSLTWPLLLFLHPFFTDFLPQFHICSLACHPSLAPVMIQLLPPWCHPRHHMLLSPSTSRTIYTSNTFFSSLWSLPSILIHLFLHLSLPPLPRYIKHLSPYHTEYLYMSYMRYSDSEYSNITM